VATLGLKGWILQLIIGMALVVAGTVSFMVELRGDGLIHGTGTVRFMGFEGGFYGIVGDDGRYYDPINMPKAFMVDGLRIRFTANITDINTFHMWGITVELISIERLPLI
jgi:hypothetical protein